MQFEALLTLSYGVYIIGSSKDGRLNAQISNTAMQVTSEPSQISIAVNKKALTHDYIVASRAFTVTVLSEQASLEFIGRFGFQSGRDIDKFAGIAHKIAASGSPYPTDYALSYLDVRVLKSEDMGTHTVFTGELVDAGLLGTGVAMTYVYYREKLRGKTPPTAPTYKKPTGEDGMAEDEAATGGRYVCSVCGYVYDPVTGDPAGGVAPGTAFDKIPDDWCCPICNAGTDEFVPEPKTGSGQSTLVCDTCGYMYNAAAGDPENGIDPGTPFDDLPDDWCCPVCSAGKREFTRQ